MSAPVSDSKIPHPSSFASRFGFGSSKSKNKANVSQTHNQSLTVQQSALHEINRNANDMSTSSGHSSSHLLSSIDRSDSPATTVVSNNSSSVSPKENAKQSSIAKTSKGGRLFSSHSKNKDKKKESTKQESSHHGFSIGRFFGIGKNHHNTSTSQLPPPAKPPVGNPMTVATSGHSSPLQPDPKNAPLLVTASVNRPTYLPAMVSADFGNNLSPDSTMVVPPNPLSPPDSNSNSNDNSGGVVSYNHKSTSALPATNPYVKPRAPSSSRPNSPIIQSSANNHAEGCHLSASSIVHNHDDSPAAGFIFRPRFSKPPLSQQQHQQQQQQQQSQQQQPPQAPASSTSRLKSPTSLPKPSQRTVSASSGVELLTPSSVESLETRLLAKSLVAPSPPPARKPQKITSPPPVTVTVGTSKPIMATLLPRVAPLAKVDSLDTNLSVSGFTTPAVENAVNRSNQLNNSNNQAEMLEIDLKAMTVEKDAQMIDFARFLQNLSDEQCLTSSCMRQSYSLDLRQIAAATSTAPRVREPQQPSVALKSEDTTKNESSILLSTESSCIYCTNRSAGQDDKSANLGTTNTMMQSTLTDVTFATSELTLGSAADVDAAAPSSANKDFTPNEDSVSDGWVASNMAKRLSTNSSGLSAQTGKRSAPAKVKGPSPKHSPCSEKTEPPSRGFDQETRKCIEELDFGEIKGILGSLLSQMQQVEPVATAEIGVNTEEESAEKSEKDDENASLHKKIADLEAELSNRNQMIEALQKLLMDQNVKLEEANKKEAAAVVLDKPCVLDNATMTEPEVSVKVAASEVSPKVEKPCVLDNATMTEPGIIVKVATGEDSMKVEKPCVLDNATMTEPGVDVKAATGEVSPKAEKPCVLDNATMTEPRITVKVATGEASVQTLQVENGIVERPSSPSSASSRVTAQSPRPPSSSSSTASVTRVPVFTKSSTPTSHVTKLHVVHVTKSAGRIPTTPGGDSHHSGIPHGASASKASTTSLKTHSSTSGLVKPTAIYRRPANSVTSQSKASPVSRTSSSASSTCATPSSPLAASTPSVVPQSRLPRISPGHSAIPTPISATGGGR